MIRQNKSTRFGLIRHATTLWNKQKRIQGKKDTPLAPEGEDQAEAWSVILKAYPWRRILTSDIGRALQTTGIINTCLNLPVARDPRLQEQDWGGWTGKTIAQIKTEDPADLAAQEAAGWHFRPPDGEAREEVYSRSRQALIAAARQWSGDTILVVTHEGVIKSLLYRLQEISTPVGNRFRVQPYRLHWLIFDGQDIRIEQANAVDLTSLDIK
jgi:broad specificity phosphatase PhoE